MPTRNSREVFLADFMELPFDEFDLILRMDWLVEYQVSLDCATIRVTLNTSFGKEIVMVESIEITYRM